MPLGPLNIAKRARRDKLPHPTLHTAALANNGLVPQLEYFGGPLIPSPQIYAVYWGTNVASATVGAVPGFLGAAFGDVPYMQMLSEYNAGGFTIGHASFVKAVTDGDASPVSLIGDVDIQAELARLIDAGSLPPESAGNFYMVFFPPGVTIEQSGGARSCETFCAYHESFARNGKRVRYAVMPDLSTGGCQFGCGLNPDALSNLFSAASHELVEAITDADPNVQGAWIDPSFSEIGDICIEWDGTSGGFVVQSEYSNADHGCRDRGRSDGKTADVTVTFDSAQVATSVTPAHFTLLSEGTAGTLSLSVADLPASLTPSFDKPSINAGDQAALTLAIPATFPSSNWPFKLTADDAHATHHFVQAQLAVKGPPPSLTSLSPSQGPTSGGNRVNLAGSALSFQGSVFAGAGAADTSGPSVPIQYDPAANQLFFIAPAHAAGSVFFVVRNPNDPATSGLAYTYQPALASPLALGAVLAAAGPTTGNVTVELHGRGFDVTTRVSWGGVALQPYLNSFDPGVFYLADDHLIYVAVPAHAAGAIPIVLTRADGAAATSAYTYTGFAADAPALERLSAGSGPTAGGTWVALFGVNFNSGLAVQFGGAAATVKALSDGFVAVTTPPHAAGPVDVVVTNPDGQQAKLAGAFTYAAVTPLPDMATPPDLSHPPDLSRPPDLSHLPDLSRLPDLSHLPDLSRLPDLSELPDLSPLPDLTPLPDLSQLPDLSPLPDPLADLSSPSDLSSLPDLATGAADLSRSSPVTASQSGCSLAPHPTSAPLWLLLIYFCSLSIRRPRRSTT